MRDWRFLILSLAFSIGSITQASIPSAAMVIDVIGTARIDQDSSAESLGLTAEVPVGRRIALGSSSRLVLVSFKTGEEVTILGPAAFTLDGDGRPVGLKREAWCAQTRGARLKQLLKPGGLAQASLVMREPNGALAMLSPSSRFIDTGHPTFQWSSVGPGARYHFQLQTQDRREWFAADVTATCLELPVDRTLAAGIAYTWILSARSANGPVEEIRGGVERLDNLRKKALARLKEHHTDTFAHRVAYAAALQSLGFTEEARIEWKALSQLRPGDPLLRAYAE